MVEPVLPVEHRSYLPLTEVNVLMGVLLGAIIGIRSAQYPMSDIMPTVGAAVILIALFLVGIRGWAEHRRNEMGAGKAWRSLTYAVIMGAMAAFVLSLTGIITLAGAGLAVVVWLVASVCAVLAVDLLEI